MRKRFLVFVALLPLFAAAQTPNFTITGKIGNLSKPAKVYIDYTSDGKGGVDSAEVLNGTFKFSGYTSGTAFARMTLSHDGLGKETEIYRKGAGDVIYFYFGKENVLISSKDSLDHATFTGSKIYDEMLAFDKEVGETVMRINRNANLEMGQATAEQQKDTAFFKILNAKVQKKRADRKANLLKYATEHPNSFFALEALSEAVSGFSVSSTVALPIFDRFSEALRTSFKGAGLDKILNANSITGIGSKAPVFTQNDANGKPISLTNLRGKYVLVEFWASWCSPCRAEIPNLIKQYQLYKDKGFEILSVSVDSDKGRWLGAIEKDGPKWLQVSDLKGSNNEVALLYGVTGVPANFLVSPEGKIIGKGLMGEALNKKLVELLND